MSEEFFSFKSSIRKIEKIYHERHLTSLQTRSLNGLIKITINLLQAGPIQLYWSDKAAFYSTRLTGRASILLVCLNTSQFCRSDHARSYSTRVAPIPRIKFGLIVLK